MDHAWAGSPGMLHKTLMNKTVEIWAKPLPHHEVSAQPPRVHTHVCPRARALLRTSSSDVSLLPIALCASVRPCMVSDGMQVAILVLNTGLENVTLSLSVAEDVPGQPAGTTYRDIWQKKDVAIDGGKVSLGLTAHDNVFAVFSKTAAAAAGVW